MIWVKYILEIIIVILILLYSLNFCIRMHYNIEFSNNFSVFVSLLCLLILITLIFMLFGNQFIVLISYCSKFSLIPMFIFFHLIIWYILVFIFSCLNLSILYAFTVFNHDTSFQTIKKIASSIHNLIKNNKHLHALNPFVGVKLDINTKFTIHRLKSIIFAFYLVAGIIVISPMYNYFLSSSFLKPFLNILKTDYDTYQKVFIVSLIPYFLNFTFIKKNNS